jgi:hypothetical protein
MERRRRLTVAIVTAGIALASAVFGTIYHGQNPSQLVERPAASTAASPVVASSPALSVLSELPIKGRAPKTGYSRAQFGNGWQDLGNCDVRNHILARDMEQEVVQSDTDCRVVSGMLHDPYTGTIIPFIKGPTSSARVQIDHVVALSDAWQKGAQQLAAPLRLQLANDPLNLLAVDGPANNQKSDADAATWLPPNKDYRCRYVARQLAVKQKYRLWLTQAEHDAIERVLGSCPGQVLPLVTP